MKRKPTKRRAVSRRRSVTKNPIIRRRRRVSAAPVRRRRVHRNPSGFASKGILKELASMDGLILVGSAVLAPTVCDLAVDTIVPAQYRQGWTGLIARAGIVGLGAWALDRWLKQRKAALGFAIGGGAQVLAQGIRMARVTMSNPRIAPAVADEIAKNPSAYDALMSGNYNSLNGYEMAPLSGYEMASVGNIYNAGAEYESLN